MFRFHVIVIFFITFISRDHAWPSLRAFFINQKYLNFPTNLLETFEESTNCCWDTASESFLWILKILSNFKRRYLCKYATMSIMKLFSYGWNKFLFGPFNWFEKLKKCYYFWHLTFFWLSYCCLIFGDVEIRILLNLTVVWFSLQKQVRIV